VDDDIRSSVDDIQSLLEGVQAVKERQHGSSTIDGDTDREFDLVNVNLERDEVLICAKKKSPDGKKQCRWETIPEAFW